MKHFFTQIYQKATTAASLSRVFSARTCLITVAFIVTLSTTFIPSTLYSAMDMIGNTSGKESSDADTASQKATLAIMLAEIEDNKAVLIDVREQPEWDRGHLENASLLPLSSLLLNRKLRPDKDAKKIYLYCHSGARSKIAKRILDQSGSATVIALEGGFARLKALGLKASSDEAKDMRN